MNAAFTGSQAAQAARVGAHASIQAPQPDAIQQLPIAIALVAWPFLLIMLGEAIKALHKMTEPAEPAFVKPNGTATTIKVPCPVCLHARVMDARLHDRFADLNAVPEMKWHDVPKRNLFNTADTLIQRSVALSVARLDRGFWECEACGARFNRRDAVVLLDSVLKTDLPEAPAGKIDEFIAKALNGGK